MIMASGGEKGERKGRVAMKLKEKLGGEKGKMRGLKSLRKGATSIAILVTALVLIAAVSASISIASAQVTVEIADASAASGETTTTSIMINNAGDAGTATVNLTYTGSVVWVNDTMNSDFDIQDKEIHNDAGYTRISAFQAVSGGLSGDIKLCDVILYATGNSGETSPLNLYVEEL